MISSMVVAVATAFWFGILTSISPCPLATNIAAVSYISQDIDSPIKTAINGLLYTLGRTISYTVLGVLLVSSILAVFDVATFLQQRINEVLGFILIFAGFLLLDIISLPAFGGDFLQKSSKKLVKMGRIGALLLGALFALSFCPISAALFFGSLIPLAAKFNSGVIFPAAFGIGTALPVLIFAIGIAFGAKSVGKAFNKITQLEKWFRRATGVIFVGVGGYYIYVYLIVPKILQ
ncbi:cytochrome c biogenesis protein [Thermotomaculum hydrothermale]|uniref:Cytochrome c biogenesis protein n=1 Tax=Thermotomaculum hydrothermale TaxID=981385 RepID=A0A7R6SYQ7_9BACT|nr:aromatic aminobenezylarsenical efflux permease ArsG family transporter [Thermotomaculum hydrothermale]BBB33044.1 cytochrome c biogenesis protein [Thermotomaculum hydrothermale]